MNEFVSSVLIALAITPVLIGLLVIVVLGVNDACDLWLNNE